MSLEINKRIKAERIKKGYTQGQFSHLLGLKESTYSQMEREGKISAETLKKIAKVLNVDILYLLYNKEIPIIENVIIENEDYTAQEKSIIKIIRNLTIKDRKEVINYIESKYKAQKSRR